VWIVVTAALAATAFGVARMKRDYVDFIVYQTAGQRVLEAAPLYRAEDQHYQFKYLPAFALAMTPFAPVDPEIAKAIWFALTVGFLIAFVHRSILLLPDRRRSVRLLAWVTGLLIGKYVVKELVNGQTNVMLGWMLVTALLAAQQGHRAAAGALVGLAVFVKPYAVVVVPWLFVVCGTSAVAAAVGIVALGLVLPVAVYGWAGNWQQLVGWYHTVTSTTPENLLFGENISFATMWAKWIGPGQAATTLAVATGVASLCAAAVVVGWRRRVAAPGFLELGLLLLLVPVLSPQGWDYVLVLGTPVIVLLVDRWLDLSPTWRVITAASLAVTSLTIFDLVGRTAYTWVLATSIESVGVLVLIAALMHVRRTSLA
jgi:hypothetical protein